jgi:hypothetical protein
MFSRDKGVGVIKAQKAVQYNLPKGDVTRRIPAKKSVFNDEKV